MKITARTTSCFAVLAAALAFGSAAPAVGQQAQTEDHHPAAQQQQQSVPPEAATQGATGAGAPQRMRPGMMMEHMDPGMMGRTPPGMMMGQQMEQMGPGMMGADTGPMGPGMMGRGMMHGLRIVPMMHLSIEDVRHFLEHHIAAHGLERLKVGPVEQTDADTITADIVTLDDSLALRLLVDPHTGLVKEVH